MSSASLLPSTHEASPSAFPEYDQTSLEEHLICLLREQKNNNKELKSNLQQCQEENVNFKQKLQSLESDNKQLQVLLTQAEQDHASFRQQYETFMNFLQEEEIIEVEHFHLMQTEDLTKYYKKKILKKRTQFSELKTKAIQHFKHLQSKHDEDKKKLNDNLEERNLEIQHLAREHKTKVEELTTLTSVFKKCQDENVQLKQKMKAILERTAEVQTSSLKNENKVEELRVALQQTERQLEEKTSVLKKCQDENVQWEQKLNDILERNAEEVQTSSLKYENQVEELRIALQQIERQLEEKKQQIINLTTTCQEQKECVKRLTTKINPSGCLSLEDFAALELQRQAELAFMLKKNDIEHKASVQKHEAMLRQNEAMLKYQEVWTYQQINYEDEHFCLYDKQMTREELHLERRRRYADGTP